MPLACRPDNFRLPSRTPSPKGTPHIAHMIDTVKVQRIKFDQNRSINWRKKWGGCWASNWVLSVDWLIVARSALTKSSSKNTSTRATKDEIPLDLNRIEFKFGWLQRGLDPQNIIVVSLRGGKISLWRSKWVEVKSAPFSFKRLKTLQLKY